MKLLSGKQIKKKREEHNLTQKELGALVEERGLRCKSSYLSFIEGGFKPEDPAVLEALTDILSAEPSEEAKAANAEKKARAKAKAARERRKAAAAKKAKS